MESLGHWFLELFCVLTIRKGRQTRIENINSLLSGASGSFATPDPNKFSIHVKIFHEKSPFSYFSVLRNVTINGSAYTGAWKM